MIRLSRLNGTTFVLNADLIKFVESTPDTLITLYGYASAGGRDEKFMVKESVDEVLRLAMDYRKKLYQEPPGRASPHEVR
jgi:flagellar protein FlbD